MASGALPFRSTSRTERACLGGKRAMLRSPTSFLRVRLSHERRKGPREVMKCARVHCGTNVPSPTAGVPEAHRHAERHHHVVVRNGHGLDAALGNDAGFG